MAKLFLVFHIFTNKTVEHLKEDGDHFFDKFIVPLALITPLMTIPQVWVVWQKGNVDGVSVPSWLGYALGSGFWVIYGLIHKEKPLTIANFLLFVFDILIVIGVLVHKV